MESDSLKRLFKEIELIKRTMDEIKMSIVDADSFLTEDDIAAIKNYQHEKRNGKLISQSQLKKQLGL